MSSADQMLSTNQRRVVLVADDDDAVLDLAARVIDGLGLVALKANDGAAALEFVTRCQAMLACVILDIQMPLLNGVEAALAIQQIAPDLEIVLMSGTAPVALVDGVKQLRPITFLQKPFQLSVLRDVIMLAVENSIAIGASTTTGATVGHSKEGYYEWL